jgi:isoleucyl-tRNA synthetase
VSASDYRDDVRISEKILKQLTDAYRRIRNTSRFLLGNLSDFDPAAHTLPVDQLLPIDRYALHSLQNLIERCWQAYDAYEFHTIYHSLYNYCTVDLSAFYLDILKDRLYTSPPDSTERRSAQTVLYRIADNLARLMAPIMVFTAEEIWRYLPGAAEKAASIHLADMPAADDQLRDDQLAEQWQAIRMVRGEVSKALEEARAAKHIGHSLQAEVILGLSKELYEQLLPYAAELRAILIVSRADMQEGELEDGYRNPETPGVTVKVAPSASRKCERCWVHDPSVGTLNDHPDICDRCHGNLKRMGKA